MSSVGEWSIIDHAEVGRDVEFETMHLRRSLILALTGCFAVSQTYAVLVSSSHAPSTGPLGAFRLWLHYFWYYRTESVEAQKTCPCVGR